MFRRSCLKLRPSWKQGSSHGPKDGQEKTPHQETLWPSKPMRYSGCAWRTNCCGIFCAPQEGSETKGKIRSNLPAPVMCDSLAYPEAAAILQPRAHPVKDWRGAAGAAPLRLILNISYQGSFLYCPHNAGLFKARRGNLICRFAGINHISHLYTGPYSRPHIPARTLRRRC